MAGTAEQNTIMNPPLVSIIIPVFNGKEFIGRAVESVKSQSVSDYELIVIDDGSTDGTFAEAEKATAGIPLCIIRQTANMGVSAARNYGMDLASGKYLAFLDADDIWHPHKLEKQLRIVEHQPGIGLICSSRKNDDQAATTGKFPTDRRGNFSSLLVRKGNFVTTSTVLVRRDILTTFGLRFDTGLKIGEDWHLWIRLSRHTDFFFLAEPLIVYRSSAFTKYDFHAYLKLYQTIHSDLSRYTGAIDRKALLSVKSAVRLFRGLIARAEHPWKGWWNIITAIVLSPRKILFLWEIWKSRH